MVDLVIIGEEPEDPIIRVKKSTAASTPLSIHTKCKPNADSKESERFRGTGEEAK